MLASPFVTLPLIVFQFLIISGFVAFCAYRIGFNKAKPSPFFTWQSEAGAYLMARSRFLGKLVETIDGKRYVGITSALLLHPQLELGSLRPMTVETAGLYRTADNLHFLLRGEFRACGEQSDLKKAWIEPMSHEQAQDWALRYSNGRDVSHV